jgi:MinD superfamily P-loop ATPase
MKELVILSGKGGTGKTSLTAAFAALSKDTVLCDADVDAADLHLLMSPHILRQTDFNSGAVAVINAEKCTGCGLCRDLCRFNAIDLNFVVDSIECEGCGVCVDLCPEQAIEFPTKTCGQWFISETRFGPMVHARLGIAEENSGKLVALVRQEAKRVAEDAAANLIITDGPPGVGCPVIASLGGATALLIVAEPSISGIHDLERVVQLAHHFKIPCMVCINKYDLNQVNTNTIKRMAKENGLPLVGHIPFDPSVVSAMVRGRTIMEAEPGSPAGCAIADVWQAVLATNEIGR